MHKLALPRPIQKGKHRATEPQRKGEQLVQTRSIVHLLLSLKSLLRERVLGKNNSFVWLCHLGDAIALSLGDLRPEAREVPGACAEGNPPSAPQETDSATSMAPLCNIHGPPQKKSKKWTTWKCFTQRLSCHFSKCNQ